jgi:hypothetical protein
MNPDIGQADIGMHHPVQLPPVSQFECNCLNCGLILPREYRYESSWSKPVRDSNGAIIELTGDTIYWAAAHPISGDLKFHISSNRVLRARFNGWNSINRYPPVFAFEVKRSASKYPDCFSDFWKKRTVFNLVETCTDQFSSDRAHNRSLYFNKLTELLMTGNINRHRKGLTSE